MRKKMAVVNKTISKYRNYHDYLLRNGYTVVGNKYYKNGFFYTPHFYDDFSCLELVNPVDQTLTGYNYIEQMLYVALEGGVAVC